MRLAQGRFKVKSIFSLRIVTSANGHEIREVSNQGGIRDPHFFHSILGGPATRTIKIYL
jgi:hypothetical protein